MHNKKGASSMLEQGSRYLFVGIVSAAIDFGGFLFLSEAISWSIQLSNVTSLLISTVFNFVMNRNFTFKSAANPARSIALYFVLLSANMAISTYAISCFVDVGVPSALGKIVMMCCIMLWNFFLYKKVVFV